MKARVLFALTLLALGAIAQAADRLNALIVVSANALRPSLNPVFAGHYETVLWPPDIDGGSNRLLSLMSGLDWSGEKTDAAFRPAPGGHGFVAVHYASLIRRGYLASRTKWLGDEHVYALSRPVGAGAVNPGALLLALGEKSDRVEPVAYSGPWPSSGTLVVVAETWGEAEDVAGRCGGRALILQMPGPNKGNWDNIYLRGRGWPAMLGGGLPYDPLTGVAGLVRARSAMSLLMAPDKFEWRGGPDSKDVVWRWFPYVRQGGLVLLVVGMTMMACVIGFATYSITLEERAPLAAFLLLVAGLAPAVLILLGSLERRFGIDNAGGLLLLELIGLATCLAGLHGALSRVFPGAHPLLAPSVLGLLCCLAGDAKWSFLSGLFGYSSSSFSAEGAGAVVAYLTSVVAFTRQSTPAAAWFGRAAVAGVLAVGLRGDGWWAPDPWLATLLPAVALFAGEGWMRWPMLFILAFSPNGRSDMVRHGFAWSPLGCISDVRSVRAVNAFDYFAFAVYPGLWAYGLIVLYVNVFGGDFVSRQVRYIVRRDPRMKSLPWAAAGLAALGAFYPALLPAAVLVAFGALIAFFHTAVWSL